MWHYVLCQLLHLLLRPCCSSSSSPSSLRLGRSDSLSTTLSSSVSSRPNSDFYAQPPQLPSMQLSGGCCRSRPSHGGGVSGGYGGCGSGGGCGCYLPASGNKNTFESRTYGFGNDYYYAQDLPRRSLEASRSFERDLEILSRKNQTLDLIGPHREQSAGRSDKFATVNSLQRKKAAADDGRVWAEKEGE